LAKFDMLKLVAICFVLDFKLESVSWRLCNSLSLLCSSYIFVQRKYFILNLVWVPIGGEAEASEVHTSVINEQKHHYPPF
jgi:hypothetical protein